MRRRRPLTGVLVTSLLAGLGFVIMRVLRGSTAATPVPHEHAPPSISAPAVTAATSNGKVTANPVSVSKTVSESVQASEQITEPVAVLAAETPVGLLKEPITTPPMITEMPAAPEASTAPGETPANQRRAWENVDASELLPGFGAASLPDGTAEWDGTVAGQPVQPTLTESPKTKAPDPKPPLTILRERIAEWSNHTPRSQIVLTIVGAVLVVGAVIATIVILTG